MMLITKIIAMYIHVCSDNVMAILVPITMKRASPKHWYLDVHLFIFFLLFEQKSLQIIHVIVFKPHDATSGSHQAFLDCK